MVVKPCKRPSIPSSEALRVWVAAAGRCMICGEFVLDSPSLGVRVGVGQLAHIVGWSLDSPRGDDPMPLADRQKAENLVLACPTCHKPIDHVSMLDTWTKEQLLDRKHEHEAEMKRLTSLDASRATTIVRVVSMIRGSAPELSRSTVISATHLTGRYPALLPGAHWEGVDADLRIFGDLDSASDFNGAMRVLRQLTARIHDGIRSDDVERLAVFAIARIPLLVELGARLDDKVETTIFQRHRTDMGNGWAWPLDPGPPPRFSVQRLGPLIGTKVALVVNLSGVIADVPMCVQATHTIYELTPVAPAESGPDLIDSPLALAAFETAVRGFLAKLEHTHGHVDEIALFPAVGVAAAVTMGRVLMPNVSPAWAVYDRHLASGDFYLALNVVP